MCGGGNLAGLRSRCLAECALNCRCRHNQGTSRYEVITNRDTRGLRADPYWYTFRYGLRYVQIRIGIRADTNWDTRRYGQRYVQIRTGIRADTNSICPDTDKNTYRSTDSSTYKYVRENTS